MVEILKADGKADADARFPLIELREPAKAAVLAWKPGEPEPTARPPSTTRTAAGTLEALVNITDGKVLPTTDHGQPCCSSPSSWAR